MTEPELTGTTETTRCTNVQVLLDSLSLQSGWHSSEIPNPLPRFALVEENNRNRFEWVVFADSLDKAAIYSSNQEYAEEWDPKYVVDLDTGKTADAERVMDVEFGDFDGYIG